MSLKDWAMASRNKGVSLNGVSLAVTVQLLVVFGGLPAIAMAIVLLWRSGWSPVASGTCALMIIGIWVGCVMAAREQILFPLRTLSNLLAALREGDYSLRAASARRADALGEVMRELNGLSQALQTDRQEATETNALLLAVISNIDLAVFTFDEEDRLRLVNDAGIRLLNRRSKEILGSTASDLGLSECLQGNRSGLLQRSFPGSFGTRWEIRRSAFRQQGRPHQLLVLSDLSQTLREEERRAWQRLIRVLGHELNNSLGPIQSISDSLSMVARRNPPERTKEWESDLIAGLDVIRDRTSALGRFMEAYSQLARLPAPRRQACEIGELVRRAAKLEYRMTIVVEPGFEGLVNLDPDQIEQALINLIKNAVDAVTETHGEVHIRWTLDRRNLEIEVLDGGAGLPNTTNLFVPFFTTKPGGSGIGLVLSRQIAEAHGGTLTVENRRNQPGCRALLRIVA
jgi:two-component system, NtrC family, nitrogen regulation sensor histidine kinase NtrY